MGNGCSTGTFGSYCDGTCHCADNSKCNKKDGTCSDQKCEKGYKGWNCQEGCSSGTFGYYCDRTCHCADNSKCNKKDGTCSNQKCEKGYKGWNCQEECPTNKYGSNCRSTCHCADNAKCNKKDGSCLDQKCEKGYDGKNCEKLCDYGLFGDDCNLKCHCVDSKCDSINGKCLDGKCEEGYKGENCQEVEFDLTLPLILGGVLTIIIIIALVIACYRWKQSKRRNVCNDQGSENIQMERGKPLEPEKENPREEDTDPENIYEVCYELTKNNLLNYVRQNKTDKVPFSNEFSNLPKNDPKIYPCKEGKRSENINKNRYKSLLPYDHSRVILKENDGGTNYINANYINFQGESNYIATQGPLKATTNDFWRMIWQEGCNTIVMLTNIVENGKVRCCTYFPKLNETEKHETFQISSIQEESCMIYTHRVLMIIQSSTQEKRYVHHFHCTIWPDCGVIKEPKMFIEFRNAIRHSRFSKPPFVVHCSTGAGRTGTFIALDILLKTLWKEPTISVFSCVDQLCCQRALMFKRLEQYCFIYDVLAEEVQTGFSEVSVNSISDEFRKLRTTEADGNMSMPHKDFEKYLSPLNQRKSKKSNKEKTIYGNVLPDNGDAGEPLLVHIKRTVCMYVCSEEIRKIKQFTKRVSI